MKNQDKEKSNELVIQFETLDKFISLSFVGIAEIIFDKNKR